MSMNNRIEIAQESTASQGLHQSAAENAKPESPTIGNPDSDLEREWKSMEKSIQLMLCEVNRLVVDGAGQIRDPNMNLEARFKSLFIEVGQRARNDKINSMKEGLHSTQNINWSSVVGNGLAAVVGSGFMIAASLGKVNPSTASGAASLVSNSNLIHGISEFNNRPGVNTADQRVSFADATAQFNRINTEASGKSEQISKESSTVIQRAGDLLQQAMRELSSITKIPLAI